MHQQWLERRSAVGDGDQVTVSVIQTDFPNPPAAHVFRDDLLGNDDCAVGGVDLELIQRGTPTLIDQGGLRR
ncbi:hypothetical protein D9M71_729140 [compost metagenome]